jgi:hypothetical protein
MADKEKGQNNELIAKDVVLGKGTRRFPADLGFSKTSHGDGSPTIDEGLVEARKAEQKKVEQQAKAEDDFAKKLGVEK